ncbi:enoyl-CoA hydratase/isomerase family protein [Spongiibacter sp. KMU-158]|uniref:Enoyl-CoA hydratase/isomerase family protein n=1 Tax=Spongiibacter pelagi TaxID=2760804 RepID=A0A927C2P7_9GAMM|nr:enoyl-CoA hydratase/isomerase family protein [Spongiibacter pelagi]MBD2858922.1 enoyl-CoA hydratase/isomerase family protein [Spongiibacter pelagi]
MSDYKHLVFEKQGQVIQILLNRPKSLNSFNLEMRAELVEVLSLAEKDDDARVVVLGSTSPVFSSGADLTEGLGPRATVEEQIMEEYLPALQKIAELNKPVIAAVPGVMAGIGAAFAMNCDLMVMADTAYMLMAFSNVGLVPDGGASWLLLKQLGYQRSYQLIAEGGKLSAHDCAEAGIANKIVPADQVLETATKWAQELAQRAPIALREAKTLLRQAGSLSYVETVAAEAKAQNICLATEDSQEAVAAFMQKRAPVFKGK